MTTDKYTPPIIPPPAKRSKIPLWNAQPWVDYRWRVGQTDNLYKINTLATYYEVALVNHNCCLRTRDYRSTLPIDVYHLLQKTIRKNEMFPEMVYVTKRLRNHLDHYHRLDPNTNGVIITMGPCPLFYFKDILHRQWSFESSSNKKLPKEKRIKELMGTNYRYTPT